MRGNRYPDEFKTEAVKQITLRVYKIADIAVRLGITSRSLLNWINKFGKPSKQHLTIGYCLMIRSFPPITEWCVVVHLIWPPK